MENILNYINYFTDLFLGKEMLLSPNETLTQLTSAFTFTESGVTIADIIAKCAANSPMVFSTIVWGLFSFLTIELLLVMPYKFIKRVIKRCRIY